MEHFNKGTKRTKKTKNLMSKLAKRPKRIAVAIKNLPENVSGSKNPFYGKKHSEETLKKISKVHKGKRISEKARKKISENNAKYWLGKKKPPISEETRRKMSEAMTKYWDKIGRKKHKRYIHVRNRKYKQWRSDVFKRDNYTCQNCHKKGGYLEAHHIKSWTKYPGLRYKIKNGITLCQECHKLTDNYKGKGNA